MRPYAFVLVSMYRYSWLITLEIFPEFFWIEGWVGGVYRIQTIFGFLNTFFYKAPKLGFHKYGCVMPMRLRLADACVKRLAFRLIPCVRNTVRFICIIHTRLA